ncbi:nickel pincer cofactor-dependent isomerase, group 22 [Fervidibacter sacchari]
MLEQIRMACITQRLYSKRVDDVIAETKRQLEQIGLGRKLKGKRIAITAGSRGIARIAEIIKGVVEFVREKGGEPFVFPAMGSHGGATAEGQVAILRDYGITEDFVGAPILATMEVERIGETDGIPVYADKFAANADGIIVVNRIKHHTDFSGPHESGLLKMMAVGMGKRHGADVAHTYKAWSLRNYIPKMAREMLKRLPILAGLAILENGYHQVAKLVALKPNEIETGDRELLRFWKRIRPKIPFNHLDVLIVERMGKDISGTGMDTKVIGRLMITGENELKHPMPRVIVVLDLTDESHGNAAGLGLADITTKRLIDKINWHDTHINVFTSGFIERDRIPVVAENDRQALEWALEIAKVRDPEKARIVRIRDTNTLGVLYISQGLWEEAARNPRIKFVNELSLRFEDDNLAPVSYEV